MAEICLKTLLKSAKRPEIVFENNEQIEEGRLGRRPDGEQTHALQVPFLQPYRP